MPISTTPQSIFGPSPADWRVDRIRDHLGPIVGGEWGDDPESDGDGVDIPVIRVADIMGLDLANDGLTIRRVKESKIPARLVGPRSILIEKSGGGDHKPVGRAVRARTITFKAICSNFMAKSDCAPTVDPSFIVYVLDAMYRRGVNSACIQRTTGIQNLRVTDYLNTKIAFPNTPEQSRIAEFLDEASASIDAAVTVKRQQLEILDGIQESAITNAVTAGLKSSSGRARLASSWFRHVPTHWEIKRLKDVVRKFVDYRGRTPEKTREGIPLVTARNIRRGRIDFSESREYIAEEDYDAWMVRGLPKKGDVLITTEAPMGEVAAVEDEHIALAQRIVLLKANHRMTKEYLRYFFLSAAGSAEIRRYATGSTALGIKARWLKLINVLVPPVDEQRAIAAYLDQYCARLEPLIQTIGKQINALLAYRKSLIHECVTGQRRVTEADLNNLRAHA